MPKVSVIIPCYNQGQYINEAVDSVLEQTFQDFEIIIVNDGSTAEFTNNLLRKYRKPKTKVILTTNQGLSSARNNGIREAQGEYILPLDADDRICKVYLEEAVEILDKNSDIGIVYCLAEYFGKKQGLWVLPEYSLKQILIDNMIFCSAFFRKKEWEQIGGYKSNMQHGLEDWDFWLSLIALGKKVYRIPKVLFYYRANENSMIKSMTKEQTTTMHYQILCNHREIYVDNIEFIFEKFIDFKLEISYSSDRFQTELRNFQTELRNIQTELRNIQNSKSYKTGKLITLPFRKLTKWTRNILRHR